MRKKMHGSEKDLKEKSDPLQNQNWKSNQEKKKNIQ